MAGVFAGSGRRRDFASLLEQAIEVCGPIRAVESESGGFDYSTLVPALERQKEAYAAPYRVAVMGEFKAGKTTFINSLLGRRDLLPKAALETTAVLTELTGSDSAEECGYVQFRGGRPAIGPVSVVEAVRYADKQNAVYSKQAGLVETVDRVQLSVRSSLIRNVVLLDTPGLGKSVDQQERTLEALHTADAILWVFDSNRIGGDLAHRVLTRASTLAARVVVVLSQSDHRVKGDTAEKRTQERATIERELQESDVGELLRHRPRFVYSSEKVLASHEAKDSEGLREWGHESLLSHLHAEFLSELAPAAAERLEKNRTTLKVLLTDARQALEAEALRSEASASALQDKLGQAHRKVESEINPRVPLVESSLRDAVSGKVGQFFDDVRKASEILIEDQMDISFDSLGDIVRAIGGKFSKRVRLNQNNKLIKRFRELFPEEMERSLQDDVRRVARDIMAAEWKAIVGGINTAGIAKPINLGPMLDQVNRHLVAVAAKAGLVIGATIGALFSGGGAVVLILEELIAVFGGAKIISNEMNKTQARTERAKNVMRLQMRNEAKLLTDMLCRPLNDLNEETAAQVKTQILAEAGEWSREIEQATVVADRNRAFSRRLGALVDRVNGFEVTA